MNPTLEMVLTTLVYLIVPSVFLIRDFNLSAKLRRQQFITLALASELERLGVMVRVDPEGKGIEGIDFKYDNPEVAPDPRKEALQAYKS